MDFVSWLCEHLNPCVISKRYRKNHQEIEIFERNREGNKPDMVAYIKDSPQKLIVIDPECCGNMKAFPTSHKWNKNCDFLMIGERPEGLFALLVELKPDDTSNKPLVQLRWSRRILYHLMSMYKIEQCCTFDESSLNVKYLVVCEDLLSMTRDATRTTENPLHADKYKGLTIYYQKIGDHSFSQILRQQFGA